MATPIGQGTIHPPLAEPVNLGTELIAALKAQNMYQVAQIFANPQRNQITEENLGKAFIISIQKGLYHDFFNYFDLNNIPIDDEWGLGHAVLMAIHTRDLSLLQQIQFNCPVNFHQIDAGLDFGLGQALLSEIMHFNHMYEKGKVKSQPEFLNILINHPLACNIENAIPKLAGMDDYDFKPGGIKIIQEQGTENISIHLGILLRHLMVDDSDQPEYQILQALMHPNIAHLYESNGPFGLGRALVHAAYHLDSSFVNSILNHPKSQQITSLQTKISQYKTDMELCHSNLNQYGLTEAIFFTVFKGSDETSEDDSVVEEKSAIVNQLLSFANENYIMLNINGEFGLQAACNNAHKEGYRAIAQAINNFIS